MKSQSLRFWLLTILLLAGLSNQFGWRYSLELPLPACIFTIGLILLLAIELGSFPMTQNMAQKRSRKGASGRASRSSPQSKSLASYPVSSSSKVQQASNSISFKIPNPNLSAPQLPPLG